VNLEPNDELSSGEARTRQRQRKKTQYLLVAGLIGGITGFFGAFYDQGDGNIFSGGWETLALPPFVAILLAIGLLLGFLIVPLWGFTQIDDYQREHNFISYTGGLAAVISCFPVWVVLHAGGFVPAPHAFGLWAVGVASMLASYLSIRWRT